MKCTLNDLCDIITDGTHQTPEYCGDEGVLFLSSKDVVTKKIDWAHAKYIPRSLHDILSSRLTPQRNDILLAKNGTTGVAALVDCEKTFDIYVSLALLRPKKSINPRFLLHAINSPTSKRQFNAGLKGIGVPNLHLNVIKNTIINVPGESKQSHIADCLDTIERLNNSRKQQLEKLDTLVKSRFIEMFGDPVTNPMGWDKEPLKKHTDVIVGYPFSSTEYVANGIPIVGGYNLMQGFVQWENSKYLQSAKGYEQYLLKDNDIVIAMDRPWVGNGFKIAVIQETYLPAILIQRTACIRCCDVSSAFLYMLLDNVGFADHCHITGSLVPHISNKDILSYEIIVPPIALQNQFAAFVAQVDKSKSVLQKLLEKQELLRAALMQEYFG